MADHLGDAWIDVHANNDPFEREVGKGVNKGLSQAEKDADQILKNMGEDFGKKISHSMEDELRKDSAEVVHAVEDATKRPFEFKGEPRRYNRDKLGRFAKTMVSDLENEVEKVFAGGGGNNFFAKIGGFFSKGFSDALQSASGVSGTSPLQSFLVPVYGALGALIVAAIEGVNGLLAVLALVPAAIAGIGLQVGALFLIFHGLTKDITAAFSAKNPAELKKAIEDLSPAAQKFVLSLLPLRDLFRDLSHIAQESFFAKFGDSLSKLAAALGPILKGGFGEVAGALGFFFGSLARLFQSKDFIVFMDRLFPATALWIINFGPVLVRLLDSLIKFANATLPSLTRFGTFIGNNLDALANALTTVSKSKDFQQFLNNGLAIMGSLFEVIGQAFQFILVTLHQLDAAGGKRVIDVLADALSRLTALLASPAGLYAMQLVVGVSIVLIGVFTDLAAIVIFLAGSFEAFIQWLATTAGPWLGRFFAGLGSGIWDVLKAIGGFFADMWERLKKAIVGLGNTGNLIKGVFTNIKDHVIGVIEHLNTILYNAGRDMIMGLIHGIESMIKPLVDKLSFITKLIPSWKGPEDKDRKLLVPAGQAIMEGFGAGIKRGAAQIKDLLTDYTSNLGGLRASGGGPVAFGPGAIRITFAGALPTEAQARSVGNAVGGQIVDRLSDRDIALSVRTL